MEALKDNGKIAYLVQTHADPVHFGRLVRALDWKADFFVHVDAKADAAPFRRQTEGLDNVRFVPDGNRVAVFWGGISQVEATMEIVDMLLSHCRRNGERYKKVVLLSGSCYPIKGNEAIHRFFDERPGVNFMRAMNVTETVVKSMSNQVTRYYFFDTKIASRFLARAVRYAKGKAVNFFARKKPYLQAGDRRLPVFHGSQWWALDQHVLNHLYEWSLANPCMYRYFRYSWASDEKYFHTAFFNSPYAATNIASPETVGVDIPGTYANIHIIYPMLGKWYDADDWDEISSSGNLFVRKVSTGRSASLLDRIDRELRTVTC